MAMNHTHSILDEDRYTAQSRGQSGARASSSRTWPLLRIQRLLAPATYPLWAACELSARALGRRELSPRENTQRAYEQLFDVLCGQTGIWPDYTEGYYPRGDEPYEEAKIGQFDQILDKLGCVAGTRLLDLGCGNGRLLLRARERGCEVTGITVSREQARRCREQGLEVILCSFDEVRERLPKAGFDAVVLNGSAEHFVNEQDMIDGRDELIRRDLFASLAYLLGPGGRIFATCIHLRHPTDFSEVAKHPLRHSIGSYYFYCSSLVRIFSGAYPTLGTYERLAAEAGLRTIFVRDATRDYYLTSKHWSRRLQALAHERPAFMLRYAAAAFHEDPRYFLQMMLFWLYDPWTWQFRGGEHSPMIHLWHVFERPA